MVLSFLKKHWAIFFILIASIAPLTDLLNDGLPITHDSVLHAARIASFYTTLSEGIIIPRWAGNLNWGYGHPVLMFVYPLPSYIAALIHYVGFSYVDTIKILFVLSYSLSGILMYAWLRKFLGIYASTTGSILYLYAPYRFVDLYVRGALGENIAFIFLPLVLLCIFKIGSLKIKAKSKEYYYNFLLLSFSFASLILSHNAISLIFMPIVLFYILYLFYENKNKKYLAICFAALISGFLISFFFWFPALIEGKYTLRDIVTAGSYMQTFVQGKNLIYSAWSYGGTGQFTVGIGLINLLLVFLSIIFYFKLFKNKDKSKYLYLGFLFFFFISIFLMLNPSNFIWEKITILQKLQFTWRFLTITAFSSAVIGAIFIEKIKFKYKNTLSIILISISIILTISYWHAREYKSFNDSFFEKSFAATTDTGECSPIWSVRSMDIFPTKQIEILEGEAEIKSYSRKTNQHSYIIANKEKIKLRENTIYFPGWKIYDNENILDNIEFQDPQNRGIITFYLDPGIHNIILKFEDTKVRTISNYISFFTLGIIYIPLLFLIWRKFND